MTLIELVVAITIVALATSAGYAALGSLADHRGRSKAALSDTMRGTVTRGAVVAWFAGAHLDVSGQQLFRGVGTAYRSGTRTLVDDEITFVTIARTPVAPSNSIVHLYVDRDERTAETGLVAELMPWPSGRITRVVLDSGVSSLRMRYLTGLVGQRQWIGSWVSSTVLPLAVEIVLRGSANDSLPGLLRTPVTVALVGGR